MTETPSTATMATIPRAAPGRWIREGWHIVRDDIGNFFLVTLIAVAIIMAASFTVVGPLVVGGPLAAGLFYAVRRRMTEGRTDIIDVFEGFNRFIDALLIGILISIFQMVGLLLCVIPFFIVGAFYLFPYLILIDRNPGVWEAMELSRKMATRDTGGYILFFFALCLLNLLGLMLAGIGVLVTIPVSIAAIAVAYREMEGFQQVSQPQAGPINIP